MKRKDLLKDIRSKDGAGLKERMLTISEELMKLRFRKATGQLEQSHRIKQLRKELAIVKTVISQQSKEQVKAA